MANTPVTHPPGTSSPAHSAEETPQACQDLMNYAKEYARERPEMAALWCFSLGFILGWKLKPW